MTKTVDRWPTRYDQQPLDIEEQAEKDAVEKGAEGKSSSNNSNSPSSQSSKEVEDTSATKRTNSSKTPVVRKTNTSHSNSTTKPLITKKKSSKKGGSAAKISKNEIAVEIEKEEEEDDDDDDDESYSYQSSDVSPYPSSGEFEDSDTDSKKSQLSKETSNDGTEKTSGIRTSYKNKNPEIKVVTNNLKTLPNLKILERRPLDEWWEEYLTSKNAGSVQPRNSYFPPQMEMQIGILMFDEDQTDMEHWKKWDDDK
jgi:hypothetical protein